MSKRKARQGETVCRCSAYRFPHRQFGGDCLLITFVHYTFVHYTFDPHNDDCQGCMNFDKIDGDYAPEYHCQVSDGQEEACHCPLLRDHIRFEGIKLYGRALQQLNRAEHRKVGYHGRR